MDGLQHELTCGVCVNAVWTKNEVNLDVHSATFKPVVQFIYKGATTLFFLLPSFPSCGLGGWLSFPLFHFSCVCGWMETGLIDVPEKELFDVIALADFLQMDHLKKMLDRVDKLISPETAIL